MKRSRPFDWRKEYKRQHGNLPVAAIVTRPEPGSNETHQSIASSMDDVSRKHHDMVEIAPHQFVNIDTARKLGLRSG